MNFRVDAVCLAEIPVFFGTQILHFLKEGAQTSLFLALFGRVLAENCPW